jgi:hypothetical protein
MPRPTLTRALPLALAAVILTAFAAPVPGQEVGVPIEPHRLARSDKQLVARAEQLHAAGKLMDIEQITKALASPTPEPLDLIGPSAEALPPREIATRARQALLRIGWFHKCRRCDKWHINLANAYAITAEGAVVTCYHVAEPNAKTMREGYLIALDSRGNVLPVTAVLAADKQADTAILRVESTELAPLALNHRTAPGDPVYLFSDPKGVAGYFSTGIINRFHWRAGAKPSDPQSPEAARDIRMHVSTDWAPGSSGAPVLDAAANVVGHVSTIACLPGKSRTLRRLAPPDADQRDREDEHDDDPDDSDNPTPAPQSVTLRMPGPTVIILHEAIPARAVKFLAQPPAKTD